MKNYYWAKGYKYVDVPIYLINFRIFRWSIRLFKVGCKRKRAGIKISKHETWQFYENLIL